MRTPLILAALGMLCAASCIAMLPRVSSEQAQWASQQWPDMNQEKLIHARSLYVSRCSACHNIVLPKHHTLEQWNVLISSMAPKAKLNSAQQELIRRYIISSTMADN